MQVSNYGRLPQFLHRLWWLVLLLLMTGGVAVAQVHPAYPQVVVAVASNLPPFVTQTDTGEWQGFSIDLLNALADQAGLQIRYTESAADLLLPGVTTQLFDAAIGCIWVADQPPPLVSFTDDYFTTGQVLVTRQGSPIHSTTDLTATMRVGIRSATDTQPLQAVINAQFTPVPSELVLLEQVNIGLTDAAVIDEYAASLLLQKHPEWSLHVLNGFLQSKSCAIAVNQRQPYLLATLNRTLNDMKKTPQFAKLYTKWFGERPQNRPLFPLVARPVTNLALPGAEPAVASGRQTLAGVYYLSLSQATGNDTSPLGTHYQIVSLTADGLWLGNEAGPITDLVDANQLRFPLIGMAQQQGVWQATQADQLTASVLSFQLPTVRTGEGVSTSTSFSPTAASSGSAFLVQRQYTLNVDANGQVTGQYQESQIVLGQTLTLSPTESVSHPVQGQRLLLPNKLPAIRGQ